MLDFKFIQENWLYIAGGVGETLAISILALLLGTLFAWMLTKGRQSASLPIRLLSGFYLALIDGTPLLLLIFFLFLALPQVGVFLPGLWAGALMLGIYYGAHISESFRASHVPLAWDRRSALPLIGREFIGIIKDSTLISVTGFMHDILWRATRAGRAQFKNLEALLIAALIYWVLILIVSFLLKWQAGTKRSAEPGAGQGVVE